MARAMDGSCAAAGAMASGEPLERDNQDERAAEYGGVPRIRGSRPRGRTGSMARGTLAPGLRATACAHVIVSGESSAPGSEWEFDVLRGLEVELGAGVGQAAEYDGVRGSGGRGQADCIHGAGCCSWERGPLCTVHGKVTDVVDTPPPPASVGRQRHRFSPLWLTRDGTGPVARAGDRRREGSIPCCPSTRSAASTAPPLRVGLRWVRHPGSAIRRRRPRPPGQECERSPCGRDGRAGQPRSPGFRG